MALSFNYVNPDRGASKKVRTAVNAVKFGDGYEQRAPEGINSVSEDWSVSWTLLTVARCKAMEQFLIDRKGSESFDWLTPRGDTFRFKCGSWDAVYDFDGACSLSAVFEQVHELA